MSLSPTPNGHHSLTVHQKPTWELSRLQGWVGAEIQPGSEQHLRASALERSLFAIVFLKGAQFSNTYKDTVYASHCTGYWYAFDCKIRIWPMFPENFSGLGWPLPLSELIPASLTCFSFIAHLAGRQCSKQRGWLRSEKGGFVRNDLWQISGETAQYQLVRMNEWHLNKVCRTAWKM